MKMVPSHNREGLIPPFDASNPTGRNRSPYPTTWDEVIERFATSVKRVEILLGLAKYRDALRDRGITDGFQWLTGSFVEQIPREPGDVDVVTFFHAPPGFTPADTRLLFDPRQTKVAFHCDAYPVVLSYPPGHATPTQRVAVSIVDHTTYWYGLFSHRRDTVWKGFVQLPLTPREDDTEARTKLLAILGEMQRKAV